MASFDVKVEDSSPLIFYAPDGAWNDTPSDDALAATYSGRSLHTASAQGATATVRFNGTGISIFGGRRSNYGTFTITVDGQTITNGDARSVNQEAAANQLLGSASGLTNGPHTAVLTNTGGAPIDIDWVDITSQIGTFNSKISAATYDDSDSMITYLPSNSAWNVNHNQAFANNTLHFTDTPGASASITFSGDAVAVYGTVSPDHANIRVTVDGQSSSFAGGAGGFASSLHPQVLLYYANNLGSTPHVLTMTALTQEGTGPFMDIDAITVYSSDTVSNGPSSSNPSSSTSLARSPTSDQSTQRPSPTGTHKSSSKAPIIGGVIGGMIGLILILALIFFFLRRRRWGRASGINKHDIRPPSSPMTPNLPMQAESMMEAGFTRVTPIATYPNPYPPFPPAPIVKEPMARHSIAPSYYSDPSYISDTGIPSRTSSLRSSATLMPKSPPSAHLASPRDSGPATNANGSPRRPSRRPPPLDIPE